MLGLHLRWFYDRTSCSSPTSSLQLFHIYGISITVVNVFCNTEVRLKKLFAIKEASTGKVLEGRDFETKDEAKKERRKLNEIEEGKEEIFRYVITLGVDHDDYVDGTERKKRIARQLVRTSRKKREKIEEAAA